ncbi:MAG: type II toxin-antitoxin system VapC family toxin [Actinomycetota bacterium]
MDSSVVLRVILGEPGQLAAWDQVTTALSSELLRVECLRTIDRARLRLGLTDEIVAERRSWLLEVLRGITLIPLQQRVVVRAADPFPTSVGTLDALHLASAQLAREHLPDLQLATHDAELALAASSVGFTVLGMGEDPNSAPATQNPSAEGRTQGS